MNQLKQAKQYILIDYKRKVSDHDDKCSITK